MTRAYISGPISANIPGTSRDERKERFHLCESWLKTYRPEWTVVNPLLVQACPDFSCGGPEATQYVGYKTTDHSWECWMRYDLKALLDCDTIVLLPDWSMSAGAKLEAKIAESLGMTPYFTNEMGEVIL